MEKLHGDPKMVETLSQQGIVIQAAQGDEVIADYWQHAEEKIRQTLQSMAGKSGTQVRFTLRTRG